MSSENSYHGRRAAEDPKTEATDYVGRRAAEAARKPNPLEQYHLGDDIDPDMIGDGDMAAVDGPVFIAPKGRRVAITETVYSTEIDGGIMEDYSKKRRFSLPVLIGMGVLVLALIGIGAFVTLGGKEPAQAPQQDLTDVLPARYPDLAPSGAFASASVKGKTFTSSNGSKLASQATDITAVTEPCRVTTPDEFCLAGTVNFSTLAGRVFFTNDVAHSATFATMLEYSEFRADKEALVANTVVDFAGAPTRFLVFMDGVKADGWFVEIPLNSSPAEAQKIASSFKYTP